MAAKRGFTSARNFPIRKTSFPLLNRSHNVCHKFQSVCLFFSQVEQPPGLMPLRRSLSDTDPSPAIWNSIQVAADALWECLSYRSDLSLPPSGWLVGTNVCIALRRIMVRVAFQLIVKAPWQIYICSWYSYQETPHQLTFQTWLNFLVKLCFLMLGNKIKLSCYCLFYFIFISSDAVFVLAAWNSPIIYYCSWLSMPAMYSGTHSPRFVAKKRKTSSAKWHKNSPISRLFPFIIINPRVIHLSLKANLGPGLGWETAPRSYDKL